MKSIGEIYEEMGNAARKYAEDNPSPFLAHEDIENINFMGREKEKIRQMHSILEFLEVYLKYSSNEDSMEYRLLRDKMKKMLEDL